MNRDTLRQFANMAALVVTLAVNAMASLLPINGQTTGEISDRFQVFFVPAGYVFAIWGLIYLGLTAFTIYQALPAQRQNARLRRVGWLFALSSLANSAWIFLWHYNLFALSVVVMLVLLASLIAIYLRLAVRVGRADASRLERMVVDLPFSIYLGWISVATIANITVALENAGWGGWGVQPAMWAAIMLVIGALLAGIMGLSRRDAAFQAVVIWAFVGIAVKQADAPLVANTAWVLAAVVLLAALAGLMLRPRAAAK